MQIVGLMQARADPLYWVRQERRTQNAIFLLLLLLCLLFAFAQRNERRLFVFPGRPAVAMTMAAPVPTSLRSAFSRVLGRAIGPVPPPPPPISFDRGSDAWRDRLLMEPNGPLVSHEALALPEPGKMMPQPSGPRHPIAFYFPPTVIGPPPIFGPGVPEPSSWLLMVLGIGAVGIRLRLGKRSGAMSRAPPSARLAGRRARRSG